MNEAEQEMVECSYCSGPMPDRGQSAYQWCSTECAEAWKARTCSGCGGDDVRNKDIDGNYWCDKCVRQSDVSILTGRLETALNERDAAYNKGVEAAAVLMQSKYAGCMDEEAIRALKR